METVGLPGKCAKVSIMSGKLKPEHYRPEGYISVLIIK